MMKISPIILTSILLTILSGLGLATIIKYKYLDEIKHYHVDICQINNCRITNAECRTKRRSMCYDVSVNYILYLTNETYSKISTKISHNSDLCSQHNLTCYYDDRYIQQSLNIDHKFEPFSGIIGIIAVSITLCGLVCFTISMIIMEKRNNIVNPEQFTESLHQNMIHVIIYN